MQDSGNKQNITHTVSQVIADHGLTAPAYLAFSFDAGRTTGYPDGIFLEQLSLPPRTFGVRQWHEAWKDLLQKNIVGSHRKKDGMNRPEVFHKKGRGQADIESKQLKQKYGSRL